MSWLGKYLGGQQGGHAPSGAETVERLCDRVQSSTLLEDRRDAVRALKSLSKKYRQEVGTQAMVILINVLQNDRNDSEILGYALETLCNVMSNEPLEEDEPLEAHLLSELGELFSEMFIKNHDNIGLLLSLLEEYAFHVRWPAVKLITTLLSNKCKEIQEIILANPMGTPKLMDLLVDNREVIRNDGLLLLQQLTRGNSNIQKIVAFENAFERLLDIVMEEGCSEGGIVVEDCLLLLLNLLKNNSSNQNFFKEGSYIQRMGAFFDLQPVEGTQQPAWSAQKVTNISLMLQLVRTLVSPGNPQQQTVACQKVLYQCGLLSKLCSILMASGVPADVLTETINAVAEAIRGCQTNQEYFAAVMAPITPPRPAIVVLLMSMVNDKQPFVLRCAVLYCFESFLFKNELGQSQIIQTLLPTTAEVNTFSAGQLLCGGLFSADSLSTWFAAVALLHAIVDNPAQQEQLLRVQLATSVGNTPISLLQQCTVILSQGIKLQTRVGLLMLLSHWLVNCPIAVTHFLHNTASVPFLISQVSASEGDEQETIVQGLCAFILGLCILYNSDQVESYKRASLRQVIEKRIGLELFTDKLTQVAKHEVYSRAAKKPQLNYKQPNEVLFDYEFTRLYRKLENEVLRAVSPIQENGDEALKRGGHHQAQQAAQPHTVDQHESIVTQYKELIREQDAQLNTYRQEQKETLARYQEAEARATSMADQIQMLRDQNALLKAQRGSLSNSLQAAQPLGGASGATTESGAGELSRLHEELESRRREIQEKNTAIEKLKCDLTDSEARLLLAGNQAVTAGDEDQPTNHATAPSIAPPSGEFEAAIVQRETELQRKFAEKEAELNRKLEQREEELKLYRGKFDESCKQVAQLRDQLSTGDNQDGTQVHLLEERNSLSAQVSELSSSMKNSELEKVQVMRERDSLEEQLRVKSQELEAHSENIKSITSKLGKVEKEKEEVSNEFEMLKKEQEDLLVLLADQETKIKDLRQRLKKLGQPVDDDDDDDDLEDGDDDDKLE